MLVDACEVEYGPKCGYVWLCACGNWAKAYDNSPTYKPMGLLADAELRDLQRVARVCLTTLWKGLLERRIELREAKSTRTVRAEAYGWLASVMEISIEQCDLAWFDKAQCRAAIDIINDHSPEFMELVR